MIIEGFIGLFDESISKFDPQKNVLFSTYASWWINQKMRLYIKNHSRLIVISIPVLNKINRIRIASNVLFTLLGKENPDPAEIAEFLNSGNGRNGDEITFQQMEHLIQLGAARTLHLDGFVARKEDGSIHSDHLAVFRDYNRLNPEEQLIFKEDLDQCRADSNRLIGKLHKFPSRNQRIFLFFYGIDGSLKRKTLEKVGELFSMSRERVRQIINGIWKRLSKSGFQRGDEWITETLNRAKGLGEMLHLSYEELSEYLFSDIENFQKN